MADLRDLLIKLGFDGARSLLQSGNLVFQSRGRTTDEIERLLGGRKREAAWPSDGLLCADRCRAE
jgi:uncharacterized protein (DUF1697 family)